MRRLVTTVVMLVMSVAIGSSAFAGHDAGAKARGDIYNFWNSRYSQRSSNRGSLLVPRDRGLVAPLRQAAPVAATPQVPANTVPVTTPVATPTRTSSIDSESAGVVARVGSNSSPSTRTTSKPAWAYPKTDPRRYRS